jgi:hypothetical protein
MFTIYQLRGRISSIHSMGISGIILLNGWLLNQDLLGHARLESPNDQRLKGSSI